MFPVAAQQFSNQGYAMWGKFILQSRYGRLLYQISNITNKCQYLRIQRVNFTYKDETEPFNNKTRLWSDSNAIKRELSPKCTE